MAVLRYTMLVIKLSTLIGLKQSIMAFVHFQGARLTAYPRLRDNPADSSEIVICDKTVDEIIGSSDALLMGNLFRRLS